MAKGSNMTAEIDTMTRFVPSPGTPLIYNQLLEAQIDCEEVFRDMTVGTGNSSYKGFSHDAVVRAVRPSLQRHGIFVSTSLVSEREELLEMEKEGRNGGQSYTKLAYKHTCVCMTTFTSVLDGSQVHVESVGVAIDYGDKAPGKAQSYAKKYGLINGLLLYTSDGEEERPDGSIRSRGSNVDEPPTEGQKQFAWKLIKRLPEADRQAWVDRAAAATKKGMSSLLEELDAAVKSSQGTQEPEPS